MDLAVVVGAQQHELVESGVVADLIGDGVVGGAPAGGGVAAGEHAAAVSYVEDGAFAAGGVASGVGGAEDGAVAVEVEADQQVGDAGVAEGFFGGGARTESIVMRSKSGTVRKISSTHHFDRKPNYGWLTGIS